MEIRTVNHMNQRVLVTAGASGIGREIARAFAANGGKVFVSDIDANGLDALSKEAQVFGHTHVDPVLGHSGEMNIDWNAEKKK